MTFKKWLRGFVEVIHAKIRKLSAKGSMWITMAIQCQRAIASALQLREACASADSEPMGNLRRWWWLDVIGWRCPMTLTVKSVINTIRPVWWKWWWYPFVMRKFRPYLGMQKKRRPINSALPLLGAPNHVFREMC